MNTRYTLFIKSVIAITFILFGINDIQASDNEELKWYEDKSEAFTAAKAENKHVFLLWGRTSCSNCIIAKMHLQKPSLIETVQENFILWFCDADNNKQANNYVNMYQFNTLPLVCIIDPNNEAKPLDHRTGGIKEDNMITFVTNNLPTANETILSASTKAYIADNILTISNGLANEIISIYTINGQLVDSFVKNEEQISKNVAQLPKGILVVSSSENWNLKVRNNLH